MEKAQEIEYLLRIADNSLVMGQRLAEWCGHGPVLEEDIAMTNMSLDQIGQARILYAQIAELEGEGRDEDFYAYRRDVFDFRNVLLCEQPNGDFAVTMARQFYFAAFLSPFYEELKSSSNEQLAAFAAKSLKEVNYHLKHTRDWVIRLGDGTEESHNRMQTAIDALWMYTGEMMTEDDLDLLAKESGLGADLSSVSDSWKEMVTGTLAEATLTVPESTWMQSGGKRGMHSEHLGFILAEMQFLPRAYPDAKW
jgi:ring-1,2-phenylacetyl-CoA epoxidase subunit PaaC